MNAALKLMERPDALRLTERQIKQFELLRGETAADHYPPKARRDAIDALVVVDMLVNAEGQVLEAEVASEAPAGFGFGLAALDAAKTFEFRNTFKRRVLLVWQFEFVP
jgi:TonB family protein